MDEREVDIHKLDCRGLHCPEPVWQTRKLLDTLPPGSLVEVLADDPLAELDLRVLCQRSGHELIAAEASDGVLVARIRVRTGPKPGAD